MSLYDDFDAIKQKSDNVAGWSSGIKLFQSQLQLKKASQTQPRREQIRKTSNVLAPVMDLKSKKEEDDSNSNSSFTNLSKDSKMLIFSPHQNNAPGGMHDLDWNFEGEEYDPMWPNDYEKVVKELREIREREKEREDEDRRKRREDRGRPRESRFDPGPEERVMARKPIIPNMATSFAGAMRPDSDEEEEGGVERERGRVGGVAIAPPPSLQESSPTPAAEPVRTPVASGASVAAKIMAKYGFKEGQGLGKKEQGISMALQVEKTSKRGGRIIHEREMMPPPTPSVNTPPHPALQTEEKEPEPSITEIIKRPSKVVLLRNMVGPGEVDQELEPEVKDECNTKYGDVIKVIIYELQNVPSEEAVKIFVEFKRIESAIKAVVDLNGRFFGGRQVKAGFYDLEKFYNLELLD